MMTTQRTVRALALELPGATRLFERAGIDYCCGGGRTLEDACAVAGVSADAMLAELSALGSDPEARDFASMSLTALMEHIVETHHVFTGQELARLSRLLAKVRSKHERNHPELADVVYAFERLEADLLPHMLKEERMLFPFIAALEHAREQGRPAPLPPFGTVKNPVRVMTVEHETAGDLLAELRAATGGYELPVDACLSFRALYEGLQELERDLHEHIHLENNILFPRAVELEE